MDFTSKRLLILCGNVVHCKVVKAAKDMGIYTIVTDNVPIEHAPAKQMADEALMLNVLDIDGIVGWCRENGVDGVVNFCHDIAQRPQQQICEKLGLPCYGTAEQYFKLTDKNAFKQMCTENGVDVIPEYSEEDIQRGIIEYPVQVKPVDSRGSRGQAVCLNETDLAAAIETAKGESSNGKVIIEKYMKDKQDFSMTYIFKDGEGHLTRIGDRYLGKKEDNLDKQCICTIAPSNKSKLFLENVNDKVIAMLKNLGIKNAPVFMQGFIDGDTIRFYDPGIRFPGSEYDLLLHRATGIDMVKCAISLALGGKIEYEHERLSKAYLLGGKLSIQLTLSAYSGKIAVFDGLDEVAKHPNVITAIQRYYVGEEVPNTGDVKQRICEVVILADKAEAKSVMDWVQNKLVILDDKGDNMLARMDSNQLERYQD